MIDKKYFFVWYDDDKSQKRLENQQSFIIALC